MKLAAAVACLTALAQSVLAVVPGTKGERYRDCGARGVGGRSILVRVR